MELTFTKTCLDVVKNLTQSFNNAVYLKSSSSLSTLNEAGYSSYVLVNDLGVDVILTLHSDGLFRVKKLFIERFHVFRNYILMTLK